MRLFINSILLVVLCSAASFAQPVYSPEVRAGQEMKWMQDSLQLAPAQAEKLKVITLAYHTNMDKANKSKSTLHKTRTQSKLMQKKDADVKTVLHNKAKYNHYYKHEQEVRRQARVTYKGPHQPL